MTSTETGSSAQASCDPHRRFGPVESVDVAICTYNRADQLRSSLDSMMRLIVPYRCSLRLIVVDNNSTDETSAVIQEFSRHRFFDRHELVHRTERNQGHTFARNNAVEVLKSDLVLWTDDDTRVDAYWVQRTVESADANPTAAFFGGKILATLEPAMPKWIEENWENLKGCFAHRDLGDQPVDLALTRLPYGANFAVRTKIQKAFMFDTNLGRRGESVLGEDEIDLFRRLLESGHVGMWVPDSIVQHVVDATRITDEYVRQYFIGQGRVLVAKGQPWHQSRSKLCWQSLYHYFSFRFMRHFASSPAWLAHLIRSGLAEGQYRQMKMIGQMKVTESASSNSTSSEFPAV